MRIVYCGAFRLPCYDAAAARVINIGRALSMAGHDVEFLSWGGRYRASDLCDDGTYRIGNMRYTITDEIDGTSAFQKFKRRLLRGKKTLNILRNSSLKPDVVIMYNPLYAFTRNMIKLCEENDIKLVSDITEWYSDDELKLTDKYTYRINMTHLQRKVKNKIVISSWLDRYYKDSCNIIVPATCDCKEHKWHSERADDIPTFDGITLIYAGNPARKDLVHVAINVVNRMIQTGAKLRFLILGISRENYIKKYSNVLADKNLCDGIRFLGRVPQDSVPRYYHCADFMLLMREPTRKSNAGFPTKFAESMTAGIPVIANSTSDIDKYIVSGHNGYLVENCTAESLERTLLNAMELGSNKAALEAMKLNARQCGEKHFDYRVYTGKLSDFISTLY